MQDYTKPQNIKQNFPKSGYTTDVWGVSAANPLGQVQGIYAVNVGHTVPIDGDQGNDDQISLPACHIC